MSLALTMRYKSILLLYMYTFIYQYVEFLLRCIYALETFMFANNFYKIKFFVLEIASHYIRVLTTFRIP